MENVKEIARFEQLIDFNIKDPFAFLGMHKEKTIKVRVFMPTAKKVVVVDKYTNARYACRKIDERGFFLCEKADRKDYFEYRLEIIYDTGYQVVRADPYSFLQIIGNEDMYLFNHGKQYQIYDVMGAHAKTVNNVSGTLFAVWAPSAKMVSVVGDFNQWDGRVYQMRKIGSSGVWEIFIPTIKEGSLYKYEIKMQNGDTVLKADPYAFFAEKKPKKASIVYTLDNFEWTDDDWLKKRQRASVYKSPMNIYEVHVGSFARAGVGEDSYLSYREIANKLVAYVKEMGYTHVELLPVMEHPYDGSWGYQVTGYYAATSRYGSPKELMYLINKCHQNDIGVILDWVPGHFPRDLHGLYRFDGTALYEHEDVRQGEHKQWGTLVFNYGRHEVKNFLIANALFWLRYYHADGLRVDAVSSMLDLNYGREEGEWIPNQYGGNDNLEAIAFVKELNEVVYRNFPDACMIAEEASARPMITRQTDVGGLGFGFKWNMGWMNDFLRYVKLHYSERCNQHHLITFSIMYAFNENFVLPLSHDEVVHGKHSLLDKMPGDYWQKFANLRTAIAFCIGHPGKKLLFMGSEFGQFIEWKYDDSLDWHLLDCPMHKKIHVYFKDINHLYLREKALYEKDFCHTGFEWITLDDAKEGIFSFIRRGEGKGNFIVFVCNFTPKVHENYQLGVPQKGIYREILNSDDEKYGGSGQVQSQDIKSELKPCHFKDNSIQIKVPPLGVAILKRVK